MGSLQKPIYTQKFDEDTILNQKYKPYLLPEKNCVEDSEKYKIGIMGGGISGL